MRRQLAASRAEAQEAIAAGLVTVDGAPAMKPATQVTAAQALVITQPPRRFVSRGGEKLDHALETFALDVAGRHALDAGVSTGGFTDCLLQRGAASVRAYDVGYGQVHDRIRRDPRVQVAERTNVRSLTPEDLGDTRPDLLVADLSFISLQTVLAGLLALVDREPAGPAPASAVLLVKPQFEAARHEVGKGGVVRDPLVWRRCLDEVAAGARSLGWWCPDVVASPLLGPAGNVEFLVHLRPWSTDASDGDDRLAAAIDAAVDEGLALRRARGSGR